MNPLRLQGSPHGVAGDAVSGFIRRLRASPVGARLARGTFWAAAGTAASRASLLVAAIVVSRILGKSGLGEFGIVQSTVSMFQVAAGLGMGLAATKYVAEHRGTDPRAAGHAIGLSLLIAGVSSALLAVALYAAAPWLAAHVLAAPDLVGALRVSSGILILASLFAAASGALAGFEAFRAIAVANAAAGVLTIPAVYAGVRWGGLTGGVWGLMAAAGVGACAMGVALARQLRHASIPVRLSLQSERWQMLWDFGLPATLGGLVVAPVNWACGALLVNQPGGYGEMGVYNAANHWRIAIFNIPLIFGQVLTPVLAERASAHDSATLRKLLGVGMLAMGVICLVPAGLVSALSPTVMHLYGRGFEGTQTVLVVLAATAVVMAVVGPIGNLIAATGRMWIGLVMNVGWGVAALGLTRLALGAGALGLALAQLGAYLLHAAWSAWFAWKVLLRRDVR